MEKKKKGENIFFNNTTVAACIALRDATTSVSVIAAVGIYSIPIEVCSRSNDQTWNSMEAREPAAVTKTPASAAAE